MGWARHCGFGLMMSGPSYTTYRWLPYLPWLHWFISVWSPPWRRIVSPLLQTNKCISKNSDGGAPLLWDIAPFFWGLTNQVTVILYRRTENFKTEITLCYGSFTAIVQNQKNECRFSRLTSFAFLLCRSNKCAVQSKGNQLNFEHETFMLMVDWCHLSREASSLVVKN